MARPRKRKSGGTKFKISNTTEAKTNLTCNNDPETLNSARKEGKTTKEEPATTPIYPLALVIASTKCTKCGKKGGIARLETAKGELICCTACGKHCE